MGRGGSHEKLPSHNRILYIDRNRKVRCRNISILCLIFLILGLHSIIRYAKIKKNIGLHMADYLLLKCEERNREKLRG